jgi:hypothetical protein
MKKNRATPSCTLITVFPGTFFSKRLGQLVLLAAILMVPFLTSAQSWDTVRVVDFSNPSFNQDLGGVQGFNAVGLTLGNNGASGNFNDLCAFTGSFSAQDRIAMRVSLLAGVDYRVSLNGKVNSPGQAVDFVYAPAGSPQQVTVISQSIPLADIDYNDPGATVESGTFSVAADGNYWVAVVHGGVNLSWVFARLDNFMVEALQEAPILSLTDNDGSLITSSIETEPGTPFTVCLSPDSAPAEDMVLELSINGDGSPHFSDFTTMPLTFPAGSTDEVCFDLSPSAEAVAGTYTFQLTDGNGQEVMSFEVGVEPPCQGVAIESRSICEGESINIGCPGNSEELCYRWEPEGEGVNSVQDAGSPNPVVSPIETTTYTVYASDANGNVEIDQVTITVAPAPVVEISSILSPPIIVYGGAIDITGTDGYLSSAYEWSLDDEPFASGTHEILADLPGIYTLSVTGVNGCAGSASIEVVSGNSSEDCSEALQAYFRAQGFYEIPIDITGEDIVGARNATACEVQDEAKLLISISGGVPGNLANDISSFYSDPDGFFDEVTGGLKAFVTRDENFCENLIQSEGCGVTSLTTDFVEAAISNAEVGHWAHFSGEVGGEGILFVSGKSPLVADEWVTKDPKNIEFLKKAKEQLANGNIPFVNERHATLLSVTGAFVHHPCEDPAATEVTLDEDPNPGTDPQSEECPNQNNDDVVCLSPAGIPIELPAGAILRFGFNDEVKDEIDPRALSGFTYVEGANQGLYRAARKPKQNPDVFFGYYDIWANSEADRWYENPNGQVTGPLELTMGISENRHACPFFNIYRINFTPDPAFPGASNPRADGIHVSDFEAAMVGSFGAEVPESNRVVSLCVPNVSFENFNKPITVLLDKDNPNNQDNPDDALGAIGWIFYVPQEGSGIARFHATYTAGNPEEITYRRWYPCAGLWVEVAAPEAKEQMDFISAFIDAALETGHLSLDLGGFIPIIGEAFDFINGIWYLAEGNTTEAALSFAATTPVIGIVSTAGKYTFSIVIKGTGEVADKVVDLSNYVRKYTDANGVRKVLEIGPPGNQTQRIGDWVGLRTYAEGFTEAQAVKFADWFLNNPNHRLLEMFGSNDPLLKVWKRLEEQGTPVETINRLFDKLATGDADDLLDLLKNNPQKVDGWKFLAETYTNPGQRRLWDRDLVEEVADALNDSEFIGILNTYTDDATQTLQGIISKNFKAVCCGDAFTSASVHLSPIDDYVKNIRNLIKEMDANEIEGIGGFINSIKSDALGIKVDEANQLARLAFEQPQNAAFDMSQYMRFDKNFPSGNKKFDLERTPNLDGISSYVELKSWNNAIEGNEDAIFEGLLANYDQYVKGYLINANSLDNIRYSFDVGKIKPPDSFHPNLPLEERQIRLVWEQWKKFYNAKAQDIYEDIGQAKFMDLFGTNMVSDFLSIVEMPVTDIANPPSFYKYIKTE